MPNIIEMRLAAGLIALTGAVLGFAAAAQNGEPVKLGACASLGGKRLFPNDNPWNQDISKEPADPNSDKLIASIGANKPLHPDFGAVYEGAPNGIPYIVVDGNQPKT